MVAGIMPVLSEEFGVSISSIGYLISAYSAGMVIGGPILTLALLKVARKSPVDSYFCVFNRSDTWGDGT